MFWLARARPYQRTKRREPPGARDGPTDGGGQWDGREGRWNFDRENSKTDNGTLPRASDTSFSKRRYNVRRPGEGRGEEATDAVQMPEARCPLRGSLWSHGRNRLNNRHNKHAYPGKIVVVDDSKTPVNGQPWRWRYSSDRVPCHRRRRKEYRASVGWGTRLATCKRPKRECPVGDKQETTLNEPNTHSHVRDNTLTHMHTRARDDYVAAAAAATTKADDTLRCGIGKVVSAPGRRRRRSCKVIPFPRDDFVRWTRFSSSAQRRGGAFVYADRLCWRRVAGRVSRGGESKRSVWAAPAVAGCGQSAGCCRVPLPSPDQWRAGRAAAIGVQTVSRSSRTAVGPDPGTPPRPPAFPTNRTVTAAAAGSAPKIGFLRVLLQHNTRTRARACALVALFTIVILQHYIYIYMYPTLEKVRNVYMWCVACTVFPRVIRTFCTVFTVV